MNTVAQSFVKTTTLTAANGLQSGFDALRRHAMFCKFSDHDFDSVLHQSRLVTVGARELLYRQDAEAHHFYYVVSGRLRLYRLDASGSERTLDGLTPGDCFAEVMIYADPALYVCYAEALKASEVLMIPIAAYRDMLALCPNYAESALRHYATRAVARFHDLEIMTLQSARDRVIRYLLDLLPEGSTDNRAVDLPLPKCLIASRLAMQPETLSRVLHDLKTSGLILVERGRVLIKDPALLFKDSP
jgi:CRP-like cAMP-binding protein